MHFFLFLVVFFSTGLMMCFDKNYSEDTLIGQLGIVGSVLLALGAVFLMARHQERQEEKKRIAALAESAES